VSFAQLTVHQIGGGSEIVTEIVPQYRCQEIPIGCQAIAWHAQVGAWAARWGPVAATDVAPAEHW
jgi:hypothetical protein